MMAKQCKIYLAEPLLTAMVLNLQSHSATSPERAAPFAKAKFGCKTHFEHEFILHFEYMIHALFCFLGYFNIEDSFRSLCENPPHQGNADRSLLR